MAERFKVDVFALHYAMVIGQHMECIRGHLAHVVREDDPEGALHWSQRARKECRDIIRTLQMLDRHFAAEIPKEKPQLRAVGEK